jgi:sensor histidine kinase YesM
LYKQKLDAGNQQAKSSLALLTKDNALKSEQLKKEAQQKTFLLITVLVLLLAGYLFYRYVSLKRKNERVRLEDQLRLQQLESEKKQSELKRQAAELQMQALRVQMNPHFIFNSLSSINWFIMENEKDRASDYLTRFSRLMRMVLNAQKPMIPLEDELKMIQLYLDMERMRFNNAFDYNISFTNAIDAGTISIPPMLLQPFCENAIWHGFMNLPAGREDKDGQGHLVINIHTTENMLECTITDNGVGRKQAALFKNRSPRKERSLGLEITRERLALLSEENDAQANFSIVDLEDENGLSKGTKVVLRIVYKTYIEKVA